MKLAIVTPSYNRVKHLKRLYKSLCNQTVLDFTWIIIDDGSNDQTYSYLSSLKASFRIEFTRKNNEGKTKALNFAFTKYPNHDFYLVVDSDDFLRKNAIETVHNQIINEKENVGAVFFRYYDVTEKKIIGSDLNDYSQELILSRLEYDSQYDKFDGAIGYYSKIFPKYLYPEVENENYMGPTVIQSMMSREYKIKFTNKVIGFAEYQPGGLTKSGRKLRIHNPISMLYYCHFMQQKPIKLKIRMKYGIMANSYYYFVDNVDLIPNQIKIPLLLKPLGFLLYKFWSIKYG